MANTTTGSDGAGDADEGQRQQEARHGLEGVDDAHQRLVDQSAGEAGERADQRADRSARRTRRRCPPSAMRGAMDKLGQHVAAEPVGAERQRGVLEGR